MEGKVRIASRTLYILLDYTPRLLMKHIVSHATRWIRVVTLHKTSYSAV